jgi:antitoxin VapB
MTERDLQYLVNREFWYWDIFPTVALTSVDERFRTYRHAVPVGATLRQTAALNICVRRWGQVISTTRVIHFGELDAAQAKIWQEGARVLASMWQASKPGNTLGDVFEAAQRAYRVAGYPDEWKLHHQGGPILGLERIVLAKPGDKTVIKPGTTLAWNPTMQGAKYEDTVLVKEDGTLENFSAALTWPTIPVNLGSTTYQVPGILVLPMPSGTPAAGG